MPAIVFAPLTTSPDTLGDGLGYLPALRSFGTNVAGAYSINILPALTTAGDGSVTLLGDGVAYLPALWSFGTDVAGGYGIGYLPQLLGRGGQIAELVPNAGAGVALLPTITTVGGGTESKFGTGIAYLPALRAFGLEAAGAYGIAELPSFTTSGAQSGAIAANRFSLVQSPGYLYGYASNTFVMQANDGIALVGLTTATVIQQLIESIHLTGTPVPQARYNAIATSSAMFSEALAVAWKMLLADGVVLTDTADGTNILIGVIVDVLHATGVVSARQDAIAAVAEAIAITDLLASGWSMAAIDSVAFNDALAASLAMVDSLVENAGFTDTPEPQMRLVAIMADGLVLADTDTTQLHAFESLREDVLFYTTLRIGDAEYAGWVLNEGAPSEYSNYPFNGFVRFNGKYYGTSDDGLMLLEGNDDAGTAITASITTALMDFGTGKRKRVPDVYVAFSGGNTMVLKVITTDATGAQVEDWYTSTMPAGSSMHNGRIKVGRGLDSVYWQYTLTNVNGADFALDSLAFRPLVLDRRL